MPSEKSVASKQVWGGKEGSADFSGGTGTSWTQRFSVDFAGVFLVFFLMALERLPAVNEPHYWTKAAHFWNAEYGRGDLFLESADAHWLFYAVFGWLTLLSSIAGAVWIGRFVLWVLLALGWTWMMRGAFRSEVQPSARPWVATLSAGLWCAAMRSGHLAGEWVVGGAEAKVAAYAFIFIGFGFFFAQRWTLAWVCLGIAGAFHVVVGLWVFLGSVVASFLLDRLSSEGRLLSLPGAWTAWWLRHRRGVPLAVFGLGVGMFPPLMADWGTEPELSTQAAMIQVYKRLGHHLAPTAMAWFRWQSFGVLLLIAGLVCILCLKYGASASRPVAEPRRAKLLELRGWSAWPYGLRWFLAQAFFALSVAFVGCLIDWGVVAGLWSREISARLLKYYWFRWNDVAWPLWLAAGSVWLASGAARWSGSSKEPLGGIVFFGKRLSVPGVMLIGVVLVSIWGLFDRLSTRGNDWVGEGERARLLSKSDDLEEQLIHYQDWLRVCSFVREKTEPGSLWLTPRNQQTFKWHTGRGEVAAWKDMPQDAARVVEWFERLSECYPTDSERSLEPWTTEKILELHKRYGFRYVLIDRRVGGQSPPLLPVLYPSSMQENSTFGIFEISGR